MPNFVRRSARPRVTDPLGFRLRVVHVFGPVLKWKALGQSLDRGSQEFRTHRQPQLRLAASNPFREDVDQILRRVAAHVRIDGPARIGAHLPRQGFRRVQGVRDRRARRPRRVDGETRHGKTVDTRKSGCADPRVRGRPIRRNLQQRIWRRRRGRIAPIGELARSDKNWDRSVHVSSAFKCSMPSILGAETPHLKANHRRPVFDL